MQYKEALKAVQTAKQREGYMLIKMHYDMHLVLPHKDGIALLNSLGSAEQLKTPYQSPPSLTGLQKDTMEITMMTREEYEQYKIAQLLNVTLTEVKEAAFKASQPKAEDPLPF